MNAETVEAPGKTPDWVFNPRASADEPLAAHNDVESAKFFMGPDPRPDAYGNTVINDNGSVPTIEMVEIININDPKNSPMIVVAHDIHRYRKYPKQYQAFLAGRDMEATGYPLREWIGDNDRVRNLTHFNVYTVEQLSAASDSLCQTLGPGTYDLRTKAKAFLASRKDSAFAEQMAQENSALKQQMGEMQAMMARLAATVEAGQRAPVPQEIEQHPAETLDQLPQRRGPGRPRANSGE